MTDLYLYSDKLITEAMKQIRTTLAPEFDAKGIVEIPNRAVVMYALEHAAKNVSLLEWQKYLGDYFLASTRNSKKNSGQMNAASETNLRTIIDHIYETRENARKGRKPPRMLAVYVALRYAGEFHESGT